MNKVRKNIVVSFLGAILILITYIYFDKIKGNIFSVTFLIIIIGTFSINVLIWKSGWFFGKIADLDFKKATFYYSEVMNTLRVLFTAFVVGFSILWGTHYVYALQHPESQILIVLQAQTILLFFFLFYIVFSCFFTFMQELKNQISLYHPGG